MTNPSPTLLFDLNQCPEDELDLNQHPGDVHSPTNSYPHIPPEGNPHIPPPPPQNLPNSTNKKKIFSIDQKRVVSGMLLQETNEGILPRGAITKVAELFSISTKSVSRIWHVVKPCLNNDAVMDFSSKMVKKVGRKRIEINLETMKSIPFRLRRNVRSLANALDLGKSTVHRRVKEKNILPHSNSVKPYLSNDNKKARLEFCLSMINEGTLGTQSSFVNMYDRIHIDEKWFYMSKTSQKYYLHPDEIEPYRTCKSKRFIPKIMFLAAVARPRFHSTTNEGFDGKIGIWPFVFTEPAKRSSKNRRVGTLETKPIASITKDVIRSCLIEKLLPAIKEKWPSDDSRVIFIQQDNAKPHINVNDVKFVEAAERYGLNISLCCQPPNSPYLNVLDLGFFRAIDSLQHQNAPNTIDEFVLAVENAFQNFPKEDLNNVFLTLQSCMVEILTNFGGNKYKIPHMNKQKLARNGQLPTCIQFDSQLLNEVREVREAET